MNDPGGLNQFEFGDLEMLTDNPWWVPKTGKTQSGVRFFGEGW